MNRIYKVVWSAVRNCYVVGSELISNHSSGKHKCKIGGGRALVAALAVTGMLLGAVAEAGSPQYNNNQSKVTNASGLETYNTFSVGKSKNSIQFTMGQQAVNGAKYVIGGINSASAYTNGSKILLYQKESGGNIYEGEMQILGGKYVFTATYDKETGEWQRETKYQVQQEDGKWVDSEKSRIFTSLIRVEEPKGVTMTSAVEKTDKGYFQTDTVQYQGAATGKVVEASKYEQKLQTGDVVSAKVNNDTLTISVNGEETSMTQAVVYEGNATVTKSLKSTNAKSVGTGAIAFGNGAAAANNAVAIGNGANSSYNGGVALGNNSKADTAAGKLGYAAPDIANGQRQSATWQATGAAVSVGGLVGNSNGGYTLTRQITNVAAGTEDSDAVNVAQLKAVAETVKKGWKLATKERGSATEIAPDDTVYFIGDQNISVSNAGNEVSISLDKTLENIDSISHNDAKIDLQDKQLLLKKEEAVVSIAKGAIGIDNGMGASIKLKENMTEINGKVKIEQTGRVSGVAAGELSESSTDAVNGSQLHATNQQVANNTNQLYITNQQVINNSNRISRLGDRVNKVGAGAAALAALHPMDFDPEDKWSFAAGYGNYAGQNATAIGAFYRPDEKVMFSLGGSIGNGENMVNAGISFALDRTCHVSNKRTAMACEIVELRTQLAQVTAELNSLKSMLASLQSQAK